MEVFSEKLICVGSWLVTMASIWNRSARKIRFGRLDAPVRARSGEHYRQCRPRPLDQHIGQRRKERFHACLVNRVERALVAVLEGIGDRDFPILQAAAVARAVLPVPKVVPRERGVHDDEIEHPSERFGRSGSRVRLVPRRPRRLSGAAGQAARCRARPSPSLGTPSDPAFGRAVRLRPVLHGE